MQLLHYRSAVITQNVSIHRIAPITNEHFLRLKTFTQNYLSKAYFIYSFSTAASPHISLFFNFKNLY